MAMQGRIFRNVVLVMGLAALIACSPIYRNHGYTPSDEELSEVALGDTRAEVAETIGQPSTSGILSDGGWYYVSSRFRHVGLYAPEEIEREVVAISFTQAGTVSNVERFGLEDGRVVALSRRVTDTSIQGVSFLQQLFGNFGRIDLSNIL